MIRQPLPNRRAAETFAFDHRWPNGTVKTYLATIGFYDDGRPGEVFLACSKTGTDMEVSIKDAAIILSIALQYGVPLDVLAPTFLRAADGSAEGPLGTLVDMLAGKHPTPEGQAS